MRLPEAFQTKHPLRFRGDGGYRILMMSDAHLKPDKEERTIRAMETLIDGTKPDLVLLNGDNVAAFTSPEMFEALLARLAAPMEARHITAAALSPGKIRPRLTDRLLIWQGGSLKMSCGQVSLTSVKFSYPMPSVWKNRLVYM